MYRSVEARRGLPRSAPYAPAPARFNGGGAIGGRRAHSIRSIPEGQLQCSFDGPGVAAHPGQSAAPAIRMRLGGLEHRFQFWSWPWRSSGSGQASGSGPSSGQDKAQKGRQLQAVLYRSVLMRRAAGTLRQGRLAPPASRQPRAPTPHPEAGPPPAALAHPDAPHADQNHARPASPALAVWCTSRRRRFDNKYGHLYR